MREIIPFQFNGRDIPAIRDDEGEPWWKAADVCQQCEIKNVSKACERLDADEKAVVTLSDSAGRPQDMLIVNEAGLYTLVLSSRKNAAKIFKRWVTHDVIPQIRKTGRYEMVRPHVKDPAIQMLIDMAVHLDEVRTEAAEAKSLATRALEGQQWITIRQYVMVYSLGHQCPESMQADYGKWLTGYCLEQKIPVYKTTPADRSWTAENTYHAATIAQTLPGWLIRRTGQRDCGWFLGLLRACHRPSSGSVDRCQALCQTCGISFHRSPILCPVPKPQRPSLPSPPCAIASSSFAVYPARRFSPIP